MSSRRPTYSDIQRPVPGSTCIAPIAPAPRAAVASASRTPARRSRARSRRHVVASRGVDDDAADRGPAGVRCRHGWGRAWWPLRGALAVLRVALVVVLGWCLRCGVAAGGCRACAGARRRRTTGIRCAADVERAVLPRWLIADQLPVQAWKRTARPVAVSPGLTGVRTSTGRVPGPAGVRWAATRRIAGSAGRTPSGERGGRGPRSAPGDPSSHDAAGGVADHGGPVSRRDLAGRAGPPGRVRRGARVGEVTAGIPSVVS